jgi:hypothetical protein
MSSLNRRDLLMGSAAVLGTSLLDKAGRAAEGEDRDHVERLYTRVVSSPVAHVNGADFRTETEDLWYSMGLTIFPVSLRLRISNRSKQPLLFPFFDTFEPILHNPDGTLHELGGGRNGTRPVMRPLLLDPGHDYTIVPTVQMRWNRDARKLRLYYEDGTGTIRMSGHLPEGKYGVSFTYTVNEGWKSRNKQIPRGQVWQGEVTTNPVAIQVAHKSP